MIGDTAQRADHSPYALVRAAHYTQSMWSYRQDYNSLGDALGLKPWA